MSQVCIVAFVVYWFFCSCLVLGLGHIDNLNWALNHEAIKKWFNSWSSHSLSFGGEALVSNTLASSCVWYMDSLVHAPARLSDINLLLFKFFGAQRRIVARNVVSQFHENGGFFQVSTELKVVENTSHCKSHRT